MKWDWFEFGFANLLNDFHASIVLYPREELWASPRQRPTRTPEDDPKKNQGTPWAGMAKF
jgi:hypothetical protein